MEVKIDFSPSGLWVLRAGARAASTFAGDEAFVNVQP
jgi:hypothetical protein